MSRTPFSNAYRAIHPASAEETKGSDTRTETGIKSDVSMKHCIPTNRCHNRGLSDDAGFPQRLDFQQHPFTKAAGAKPQFIARETVIYDLIFA